MAKVALLYPPITDPTSGYHSLSYIDSYARAQGHPAADLVDVNIEAFHYSYSPAGLAWLDQELAAPRDYHTYGNYTLNPEVVAAHMLRVGDPDPQRVRDAVATLQDPERFYDYGQYQEAVDGIIAWQNCMSLTGFPGQFREGFHLEAPPMLGVGSAKALTDHALLSRLSRPYQSYYETVLLPRLARGGYDMIGLNITYQWQLPFALWLARLVRERLPGVFLVAGGTEVSDVFKSAAERSVVFQVFDSLDAIVVGEGETAYVELLEALDAGRLPTMHPNIRLHPRYGAVRALPMLHYEKLSTVPTPDFSRLPWQQYLSPEPFVYYSPSRGCYWNKCTFCDYGLNTDGPTSPWRQDTVDTMIRDVTELSKFAKFIYFSVDVLAPATILRFAEQVVDRGLDFRWGGRDPAGEVLVGRAVRAAQAQRLHRHLGRVRVGQPAHPGPHRQGHPARPRPPDHHGDVRGGHRRTDDGLHGLPDGDPRGGDGLHRLPAGAPRPVDLRRPRRLRAHPRRDRRQAAGALRHHQHPPAPRRRHRPGAHVRRADLRGSEGRRHRGQAPPRRRALRPAVARRRRHPAHVLLPRPLRHRGAQAPRARP
ncbi:hypothetical protein GCM10018962_36010 [Dactylosporangium matsuzakiense]